MSRYIKVNRFTGHKIVWDKIEPLARAVEETGRKVVTKEYGNTGAPMLSWEAEVFVDMIGRGVSSTRDIANEYSIE